MSAALPASSTKRPERATFALLLLVLVIAAAHLGIALAGPPALLWGDEPTYLALAQEDARLGRQSVLPGAQRFEHQPALGARLLASLAAPGLGDAAVLRRAGVLNAALFALLLVLVERQGRALGLGRWCALAASALLALFPWIAFHVHSLWPEVLHAFLSGLALWALVAYLREPRAWRLVPCGLAFGYALLAKGTLQPFVPLAALFVAWAAARASGAAAPERRPELRSGRLASAMAALALFAGSVAAVVGPQLVANARAGHGARLAANRWWNLELGLTIPAGERAAENPFELEQRRTARYFRAAETPELREERARERVRAHVAEHGLVAVAVAQARKLVELVLHGESCLDQSLAHRGRWGDDPPAWIAAARVPGRVLWYALLVLGSAGACLAAWRGARERDLARLFLAAFVLLYWLEMLLVPVKVRFLLPLVPVLCLLAGVLFDELASRVRAPASTGAREASPA